MAEVSVQLHACLNAMKNLSREKKDIATQNQREIAQLKKEYEDLGKTIKAKEATLMTASQELDVLDAHIRETQQSYKKILDSTNELMKQVSDYNPAKSSNNTEPLKNIKDAHISQTKDSTASDKSIATSKKETKITTPVEDTNQTFSSRFKHLKRGPNRNTKSQESSTEVAKAVHFQSEENVSLTVEE